MLNDKPEKQILVVDDERSVREILSEGLDCMGYSVVTASSAAEAYEMILADRPRLVLSDIEMPEQNGLQLLEKIKANDPELDVIMVTGVVDAETAVGAIRKGAADYVTKPFNLEEVQIIVERTLEARRLITENKTYQTHLEELVAQRTEELENSYESTLQALVTALDFRDNETQGHSFRVVQYAVIVAEKMGICGEELDWIRRGAILHDVGKIGITDSILRKPGKLDPDEWEEMKKHPEMGFRMLEHIKFLEPALDIVLSHQERYDGSGYPRGLAGEQIPIGARIFSVVDTFDAMTSDRPYRAARPIAEACQELREWSGRQFDPEVVDAFLSIDESAWLEVRERVHDEVVALEEQVRRVFS